MTGPGPAGEVLDSGSCRGSVIGFYAQPGSVRGAERPPNGSMIVALESAPWGMPDLADGRSVKITFRLAALPSEQRAAVAVGSAVEFHWSLLMLGGALERHGHVVLVAEHPLDGAAR